MDRKVIFGLNWYQVIIIGVVMWMIWAIIIFSILTDGESELGNSEPSAAMPRPAVTTTVTVPARTTTSTVTETVTVTETLDALEDSGSDADQGSVYYSKCSEAPGSLYEGDPGYRSGLDRDGDGVACE